MRREWLSIDSCMVKTLLGRRVRCSHSTCIKWNLPTLFFVTAKTTEVDGLRFKDKDLETVGTLEYGQFGVASHCCFCLFFA